MEIPPVVIDRLPLYTRALASLEVQGREVISSQDLGTSLGVTPAQIRKDLSYFGRFGKQGRGYNVRKLLDELHRILGLDRQWRMVIVGAGKLGRALLGSPGPAPAGPRQEPPQPLLLRRLRSLNQVQVLQRDTRAYGHAFQRVLRHVSRDA